MDPMLPPWLMMPPINSMDLICLVNPLFKAITKARPPRSCLIREAMAFVPNMSPFLLTHIFLSTYSLISFIRYSYFEFSKLLKKLRRWNGNL